MAQKMTAAQKREKENAIQKSMEKLGLTREEAEEMWAFDNDEIECEEVDVMSEKAKEVAKKSKGSPLDKVREMKAKKKKDAAKEALVNMLFEAVENSDLTFFCQQMSATKISFMDNLGSYYTVALTKHKAAPDGYKGGM